VNRKDQIKKAHTDSSKLIPFVDIKSILIIAIACCISGVYAVDTATNNMSYIDNGIMRLGIDLDLGGAITYLADSKEKINIVNNFDWGRQIQMSFYSGPIPYTPNEKQPHSNWVGLGWNPIQSGDHFNNRSKIIDYHKDVNRLYVKCIPMHWPLNNEPAHCTFESWIKLKDNTAQIRCRINNHRRDKTQYQARDVEQPAIYTNGPYHRLITYTGNRPFTFDDLTQIDHTWPADDVRKKSLLVWENWIATENWTALVRDDNWGLGVWSPGIFDYTGGFSGNAKARGRGGSKNPQTGYMSPLGIEILDHNIQYEYSYVLILGTVDEIRQYVYDNEKSQLLPDYQFNDDRQHWYYKNCNDAGWPINGNLLIPLEKNDPQLISPLMFFQAKDMPKLYIRAAYYVSQENAVFYWKNNDDSNIPQLCLPFAYQLKKLHGRVYWKNYGDKDFSGDKKVVFEIKSDGKYHTYELDLTSSASYKGAIVSLRFDPPDKCKKGDYIKIKSLSYR